MRISIIQPDIIWEDRSANFKKLDNLISPLFNKTDLIILPEMFNTGFSMNPVKLSEPPEGETFKWMSSRAKKGGFGVCGSYIVKENDKYYNRWVFVSSDNEKWSYDKRHLFSMGGENTFFTGGQSRLVFTFREMRISPYICYDLRFPVWSRNKNDCDLIIYSANWPDVRINVWNILLKARAIENQCYVAGANRTGTDGAGIVYRGDSLIIDPRGDVLKSSGTGAEESVSADLSLSALTDFRRKFPVSDDADAFEIIP